MPKAVRDQYAGKARTVARSAEEPIALPVLGEIAARLSGLEVACRDGEGNGAVYCDQNGNIFIYDLPLKASSIRGMAT